MILLPHPPKIISKKENWARFEIEALYPGYGVTIGNALRRVLLSSLSGTAVTQAKIKGIQHEFATINGVLEDVITIVMNLKQMRFKMYVEEPQKAILKVKGEKKIKGSDFKFPSQVGLVNKDCHIATLTNKKAQLEMEIQIEKGTGYEPVERRKKQEKLEIGLIPVDAIFTPVKRVSFKVENMRVGERTDFDRLYLEIETDGIITPTQALSQASEILLKHYSLFTEALKTPEPVLKEKKVGEKRKEKASVASKVPAAKKEEDVVKIEVENLKLSARALNALTSNNIRTVGGILKKSKESLSKLEGMGEKGVKEIEKALKKLNLELK